MSDTRYMCVASTIRPLVADIQVKMYVAYHLKTSSACVGNVVASAVGICHKIATVGSQKLTK